MPVCTHDLFIFYDFIDKCRLLATRLRLRAEHGIGALCDKACREKGKRRYEHDDKRDFPVDDEHKNQCSENGDDAGEKLRKSHEQSIGKLIGIGDDAADDFPVRVRIHIRNGELLQFLEGFGADVMDGVIRNFIVDNAHHPLKKRRRSRRDANADKQRDDFLEKDAPRFYN